MSRERYLVKSYGDNITGTTTGLAKFLELCVKYGGGTIVIPTIKDAPHTLLAKVLGESLTKELLKNREITFNEKTKIKLCGSVTLKNFSHEKVYLALWGTKYIIEDIENTCSQCLSTVLVTWSPQDSVDWVTKYQVTVIYDDKKG